jgi:FKBP-type peptidyl-prolyl cis-trans isomerase SlyD
VEVAKDRIVSIDYTLTGSEGNVLDSSQGREPLEYLHGASNIIPGLESALEGRSSGDQLNVSVPPEQGYGLHDPGLVQMVKRKAFQGANTIEPGMQFQGNTPQGPRIITVTDVKGDDITIDANHPLAGQTLNFDVKVVNVRHATPEELSHGHAHAPQGHPH